MPFLAHRNSMLFKQLKEFGYQDFNEHSADKLIVAYIFEI